MRHRSIHVLLCAALAAASLLSVGTAPAADNSETPANIIADHIRQQGFACDNARSAVRDPGASRPDEPVWILHCGNAAYRVRLIPDMAAQVEPIR